MFIDNNINEIQNHLKTLIKNTIDPKDIEILVNSYKNIGTPIIIDNNTSANEVNRVYYGDKEYDGEFDYRLGFEDGKKIYLGYIYNELENYREKEKDFAFINNNSKAREDNKLIINYLENLIKKLGVKDE